MRCSWRARRFLFPGCGVPAAVPVSWSGSLPLRGPGSAGLRPGRLPWLWLRCVPLSGRLCGPLWPFLLRPVFRRPLLPLLRPVRFWLRWRPPLRLLLRPVSPLAVLRGLRPSLRLWRPVWPPLLAWRLWWPILSGFLLWPLLLRSALSSPLSALSFCFYYTPFFALVQVFFLFFWGFAGFLPLLFPLIL